MGGRVRGPGVGRAHHVDQREGDALHQADLPVVQQLDLAGHARVSLQLPSRDCP